MLHVHVHVYVCCSFRQCTVHVHMHNMVLLVNVFSAVCNAFGICNKRVWNTKRVIPCNCICAHIMHEHVNMHSCSTWGPLPYYWLAMHLLRVRGCSKHSKLLNYSRYSVNNVYTCTCTVHVYTVTCMTRLHMCIYTVIHVHVHVPLNRKLFGHHCYS